MKTVEDFAFTEALERELERKRVNFIEDYGLQGKPALIWQCIPLESAEVDVTSSAVNKALQSGASEISDAGWWGAFEHHRSPRFAFDGIASGFEGVEWGFELHTDGHLVASVWTFPDFDFDGQPGIAIPSFYAEAFGDFIHTAKKVNASASTSGDLLVTCTFIGADSLPMVDNHRRVLAQAPKRKSVRWPLLTVKSEGDWEKVSVAMSNQLFHAYGLSPRKTR